LPDGKNDTATTCVGESCTLYRRRRFVIQCSTVKRTLLAIFFAVLPSLMFAPHSGRGLLRFSGYANGPFFIMPSYIDGKQLVLQTIFIAVVFALIVNIKWRRRKEGDRD
jgi:hypothetical protein